MSSLEKLGRINIKYIWFLMLLSLFIPSFIPLGQYTKVSSMTADFYQFFTNMPEGKVALIVNAHSIMTYYPIKGALILTLKLLMEKNVKFVIISLAIQAPIIYPDWITGANPEKYGYEYGKDYVLFGYLAGEEMALASFASDVWNTYNNDFYGNSLSSLPLMQNIHSWQDFDIAIGSTHSTTAIDYFVRQLSVGKQNPLNDPYSDNGLGIVFVPHSSGAPDVVPYVGIVPGVHVMIYGTQGAAELEHIARRYGHATAQADAKNLGVIVLFTFVVFGNIAYFAKKFSEKEEIKI